MTGFAQLRAPSLGMLALACWAPGCSIATDMPMEKPEAGEITYSVGLPPADLPLGGIVYDKDDFPHYRSSQAITEDYLAAHRLGWRHRLAELDLEWNLERMPIALLQGYVWQQRGLGEGHKACQERVKAIAEEYGPEHAREAVHRALEKMRRASR